MAALDQSRRIAVRVFGRAERTGEFHLHFLWISVSIITFLADLIL